MDELTSESNTTTVEQEPSAMETSIENIEKPAPVTEEDGIAPEAMEIHDINESQSGEAEDLDKSIAPLEKSMEVSILNSSAIDPFDSLRNTRASGDSDKESDKNKDQDKTDANNDSGAFDMDKEKTTTVSESGRNTPDDLELPKLPEIEDESRPGEIERDAATPDLEDLDEPEPANEVESRDNSPARDDYDDEDDDAPAEGK